jgi:hypothetical protein
LKPSSDMTLKSLFTATALSSLSLKWDNYPQLAKSHADHTTGDVCTVRQSPLCPSSKGFTCLCGCLFIYLFIYDSASWVPLPDGQVQKQLPPRLFPH